MPVCHDKHELEKLTFHNVFLNEDVRHHLGDVTVAVNMQAEPVNHGAIMATDPSRVEGLESFLPSEMEVLHEGTRVLQDVPVVAQPIVLVVTVASRRVLGQ